MSFLLHGAQKDIENPYKKKGRKGVRIGLYYKGWRYDSMCLYHVYYNNITKELLSIKICTKIIQKRCNLYVFI